MSDDTGPAASHERPCLGTSRMKGKRVQFDDETWLALDTFSRDTRRRFEDLAAEAFADLLKKHGRPKSLKEALQESARREPANDGAPPSGKSGTSGRSRRSKGST